ncbi:MAG: hypothetical protein ACREOD_05210 [Candidatus Dormibacteria bacterium]
MAMTVTFGPGDLAAIVGGFAIAFALDLIRRYRRKRGLPRHWWL